MALSVGTELAALLLGANGAEAGPRRAPGGPTAAIPGADVLPGFADLLAAATAGEAGVATAPAVVPQPGAEAPAPPPAIRPKPAMPAAMPWDALAAAAEAADGLAAPFQWPGNAQPAPALVPEALASVAEDAELPTEPAMPEVAQDVPLPLAIPVAPAMPVQAARPPAKTQQSATLPLSLTTEAPLEPQTPEAKSASFALPSSPEQKPGLETLATADLRPSLPSSGATPEAPAAGQPIAAPQPADASPAAPAQDGPEILAAMATSVAPRLIEARRGDTAAAPTRRAETSAEKAVPIPLQPVEASDPVLAATAWKEMPATPRESDAKGPTSSALAPAVEPELPAAAPPAISFEAQRPAESARPVAAAAVPLVLRPHQVAEAGQQIVLRTSQAATEGVETISVDLRPPELGRVEVRLTFREGTVQVSMTAERVETYEAFRHDRASLEQQMQQSGLQLGSGGLDLQHGRLPPREGGEPERRTAQAAELATDDTADDALAPLRPRSDSLIDLIA